MFAGGFYLADFDAEQSNALTFLTGSWVSVSTFDMFHILVGIALPISIGGILVSYAYKNYEASFLAPFEYGALVIAVVSTYLIWNEIPDRLSLIGMILINAFWNICVIERKASKLNTIIKKNHTSTIYLIFYDK